MSEDEESRDGEGFLAAWSRRKRAAARAEARATDAEAHAPVPGAGEDTDAEAGPDAAPEIGEEELAALPPVEEITGTTDLQPFLKPGVPAALRKAALRKVWLSNALIRNHDDPAVDYAWDWNAPEAVPGAGGALQGDKVAKMVEDLINRDGGEPAPDDASHAASDVANSVSDGEVCSDSDATPGDGQELAAPADPRRHDEPPAARDAQGGAATDPGDSTAPAPRPDQPETPAPRRHGGAAPR